MPIMDKRQKNVINNTDDLIAEYGVKLIKSGPGGMAGEVIIRKNDKINVVCDESGDVGVIRYGSLKKQLNVFGFDRVYLNRGIINSQMKIAKYGYAYNNREKARVTNLERHGTVGVPRSDECKRKLCDAKGRFLKSKDGIRYKERLSLEKKQLYSDKRKHPMYGRQHSERSKRVNRDKQLINVMNGKHHSGSSKRYKQGVYQSTHFGQAFKYRSSWELKFLKFCEMSNEITNVEYEKVRIPYQYDGRRHIYIVDYLIQSVNGNYLVEVKPDRLKSNPRNVAKFKSGQRFANERSDIDQYVIVSESNFLKFFMATFDSFGMNWMDKNYDGFKKFADQRRRRAI